MTVTIPGYGTLTGRPKTILRVMQDCRLVANVLDGTETSEEAEKTLRLLEKEKMIIIRKEVIA